MCNVQIGGETYCSQCNAGAEYLVNGKCKSTAEQSGCTQQTVPNGTCKSCGDGYFLHKGGCYKIADPPGSTICKTAGTAGLCEACQAGYFKHPASTSDATKQSCIACSDETGADSNLGVASCVECTPPTTPGTNSQQQKATCTKCASPKYLKTDGTCGEASDCTGTAFPKADNNAGNKCVSCSDNSNGGITNCAECSLLPSASRSSTALITCTKCSKNNLSPLKNECMQNCPAGTYDSQGVCTPCHASCSECTDDAESSCTACYPGHVLNRATDSGSTGTCIPECTGRYAENCEADMCTAVLGGSKYCSRCKSGFVPVDGLCVSAGTRAPPNGCTPGDGVCSSCTGTYFLESGGCYNTQTLPGSAVCTAVTGNNGQCTTCANGQQAASGVCPACPAGCSKCTASSNSQTCSECLAGYYKTSANTCVKCDTDDSNIKGVPNCVSCAAPTSNSGPVTCYVTQTPAVDPTDPSVNKGGLSSGAIAGISVAVIAVVGGLVGFFCRR